jgi:hypothetical protein
MYLDPDEYSIRSEKSINDDDLLRPRTNMIDNKLQ